MVSYEKCSLSYITSIYCFDMDVQQYKKTDRYTSVYLIFDSCGEEISAQCLKLTVHLDFYLVTLVIRVFLRTSSVFQNDGSR
jgi:hypothetical protein